MNDEIVFQIGLSRAGTQSLTEALKILGYKTAHEKVDGEVLYQGFKDKIPFERYIKKGYNAFLDMIYLSNYEVEVLYGTFPKAKFIYLDRNFGSWLRSFAKVETDIMFREEVLHDLYQDKLLLKSEKEFDDRTLIMNIPNGDGWEKLCPFLEKEIPSVKFPNKDYVRK
ncbi:MAG: sulfotransferase [Candidatus Ranarchaeia archaeon]|jgi:hypothetical protein